MISQLDRDLLEMLDKETLISVFLTVRRYVSELQDTVGEQAVEIQKLRDELAESRNTGEAPRSDGSRKRRTRKRRKKAGRRRGG